ncbi:MAG: DUF4834 family protein [Bacteroidales bacterium]|jgi:sortase (surface protein transpeptidase)|nr:DUF4834 family protein [Bacteroidales bacterium]
MGVLLKTVLIILLIYFLIKAVARMLFPFLFNGYIKKNTHQRMQQEEMSRNKAKKKEGEVSINYKPKSEKNFGKDEGDYIDFEEIK